MKNINKDKLISLILLIIGVIGLSFSIISNENRYKVEDKKYQESQKVNKEQFAMYVEDDSGNYVEYKSNTFPTNYVLNKNNSKCVDVNDNLVDDAISTDANGITVTSQKTVFCYLYFDLMAPQNFVNFLLNDETRPSSLWTSTLEGDGYRFVGTDPSNYICFGTDDKDTCIGNTELYMYRIIGIFKDSEGNDHLKLIKKDAIGYTEYGSNAEGWGASSIYTDLNGYYFLNNPSYSYMQNTVWTNKINDWTWSAVNAQVESNLGPDYTYISTREVYYHEMNNANKTSTIGLWTSPRGKIGLMYASDYLLALGETSLNLNSNSSCDTLKTGWLNGEREWVMPEFGYVPEAELYIAYCAGGDSCLVTDVADVTYYNRPVFYLEPSEAYKSGTGTESDPFIIEK